MVPSSEIRQPVRETGDVPVFLIFTHSFLQFKSVMVTAAVLPVATVVGGGAGVVVLAVVIGGMDAVDVGVGVAVEDGVSVAVVHPSAAQKSNTHAASPATLMREVTWVS